MPIILDVKMWKVGIMRLTIIQETIFLKKKVVAVSTKAGWWLYEPI